MEGKILLCKDCHCCPTVEFLGDKVRIGENDNVLVLKKNDWNTLIEKIKSGELKEI